MTFPPSVPPHLAIAPVRVTQDSRHDGPLPSLPTRRSSGLKATPLWALLDGWVVMLTWVAAPAVMVIVPDVAELSPVALKLRVRSPAAPVIDRFVKLAAPFAFVVAVSVPTSVPPPVAIAAATVTPAWLSGLRLASRTWFTGCWATAVFLWALLDGWVVMLSCVAAPAVIVTVVDVALVSPVAVNVSVRSPTVPVIDRSVKLATPLPLV